MDTKGYVEQFRQFIRGEPSSKATLDMVDFAARCFPHLSPEQRQEIIDQYESEGAQKFLAMLFRPPDHKLH